MQVTETGLCGLQVPSAKWPLFLFTCNQQWSLLARFQPVECSCYFKCCTLLATEFNGEYFRSSGFLFEPVIGLQRSKLHPSVFV
jgi:hypothetical protein